MCVIQQSHMYVTGAKILLRLNDITMYDPRDHHLLSFCPLQVLYIETL